MSLATWTRAWSVLALLAIMSLVSLAHGALVSNVTLAWDPSPATDVAGYRLYAGLLSQTYTVMVDVGNATTGTLSNLLAGTTYYFAVTAYDVAGLESPFSGEIAYTVPLPVTPPATLSLSLNQTNAISLTGSAPAGYSYAVQASSDLASWTTIGAVTADPSGALQFSDPGSVTNAQRFYRFLQTSP